MEHPDRRPSFEKALEADVLYALTHADRDATIKGNKINNYDFLLPNLNMKIEFKATRHGGKNKLNEIRFGRKGKRIADYYLLIAPKIPNTIDFLKECQDMNGCRGNLWQTPIRIDSDRVASYVSVSSSAPIFIVAIEKSD
jgi:hypothetical protein